MKFGIMQGADRDAPTVAGITAMAKRAEAAGFDSLWMAHIRSLDAVSALTVAGIETSSIELGTAVTPIYPHHPMALAQQALTAAQACDGRFVLGIGVSHKIVVEGMLGMSYDKPAKYMRDYLGALTPLLNGEITNYEGEQFTVTGLQIDMPGVSAPSLIIAALGPVMLRMAGALADGTNTWMVGPKTLQSHIAPALATAAADAGRPVPRIIAGFPVVLTSNIEDAREKLRVGLEIYGQLPSYRAMLDREGVEGPEDLALIGDEKVLAEGIERIRDAGVTDFNAAIMDTENGAFERTFEFLSDVAKQSA